MQSVLVLNATYQPLTIVPAKRAIQLMLADKATPLDGSGKFFNSAKGKVELPFVILLTYVVKQGRTRPAGFSRRGVLARDNYDCVYCGAAADTIDHVVPRALGGKSTYDNCVAACTSCNGKKANRTLAQMGWTVPPKNLRAPSHFANLLANAKHTEQLQAWKTYISMFDHSVAK